MRAGSTDGAIDGLMRLHAAVTPCTSSLLKLVGNVRVTQAIGCCLAGLVMSSMIRMDVYSVPEKEGRIAAGAQAGCGTTISIPCQIAI